MRTKHEPIHVVLEIVHNNSPFLFSLHGRACYLPPNHSLTAGQPENKKIRNGVRSAGRLPSDAMKL
jgi:hypothetical protein